MFPQYGCTFKKIFFTFYSSDLIFTFYTFKCIKLLKYEWRKFEFQPGEGKQWLYLDWKSFWGQQQKREHCSDWWIWSDFLQINGQITNISLCTYLLSHKTKILQPCYTMNYNLVAFWSTNELKVLHFLVYYIPQPDGFTDSFHAFVIILSSLRSRSLLPTSTTSYLSSQLSTDAWMLSSYPPLAQRRGHSDCTLYSLCLALE